MVVLLVGDQTPRVERHPVIDLSGQIAIVDGVPAVAQPAVLKIENFQLQFWRNSLEPTLLYGLQSSSANKWWILASVRSFLEGLYSSSCMSMFHVLESSWLKLVLQTANH